MSKKSSIKPIHLAFIGLTIIVLGILIPSFFINPLSAMGLAIMIGAVILLSAYIFFAINVVRSRGKKTIKWLALPFILGVLVAGGLFANYKYQQSLNDKIYGTNETVSFSHFKFKVSKVGYDKIPLDTKGVNLSDRKDCATVRSSEKHDCDWYNWPRQNAQNYLNEYTRATIDYEVTADKAVDGNNLSIEAIPDSGRKIIFNTGADNNDETFSWAWVLDLSYTANPKSDFGGDLNKGLTRKGTIGVDLKESERTLDLTIKHQDETRIIRISR